MPLDNSLNADITRSHDHHCRATATLHKNDPRKFSMATPKMISRGIHRLFECADSEEGVPNSSRIKSDCDRAWKAMWIVYQHKGAIVEDLVDRNGHCYRNSGTGKQGGKRIKSERNEDN